MSKVSTSYSLVSVVSQTRLTWIPRGFREDGLQRQAILFSFFSEGGGEGLASHCFGPKVKC